MAENGKNDGNVEKPKKKRKSAMRYRKFHSGHTGWYARRPLRWEYSGREDMNEVVTSFMKDYNMFGYFQEALHLKEMMLRLGEDFLKHMRPVGFQSGILQCIVDSPVWNHQYTMMKEDILKRLNSGGKGLQIRDIRFKVGNFRDSQYFIKEEEKDSKFTESIQLQPLTDEDCLFLDGCVEELPSDLRPVVRETLEVILKHRKLRGLS